MKNFLIFFLLATVLPVGPSHAQATSGACSSHGGANCSYKSSDGNAICNDGWESSVAYSSMIECTASNRCSRPVTQPCSDNKQAGLFSQAIQNGSARYTPELASGEIQACKNKQSQYIQELNSYNTCIAKLSNPQIYPSMHRNVAPVNSYQNNPVSQVNSARMICIKWQVAHGYVSDGLCCSEAKGIIAAFAQEHPQLCVGSTNPRASIPNTKIRQSNQEAPKINSSTEEDAEDIKTMTLDDLRLNKETPVVIADSKIEKQNKFFRLLNRLLFWRW